MLQGALLAGLKGVADRNNFSSALIEDYVFFV